MGLLDRILAKLENKNTENDRLIYAPIAGEYIEIEKIPDQVFSQGILGAGCGIEPTSGEVYSPVNGEVNTITKTKHAIGITNHQGGEFLIHVGMDTVDMNGLGFDVKITEGSKVKAGDLILTFDIEEIKKAGHPITTAFVLTNSDEFSEFKININQSFKAKDLIGEVKK